MLLDERPLVLLPSLAKAVGAYGAIALQQLHFHLANPSNGKVLNGERWIFKRYDDWQKDDFPFWSIDQLQRIFWALQKKGLIVSCQPEGRSTRIKYYRIDYDKLEEAIVAASLARAQEHAKSRLRTREIAFSSLSETTRTETTQRKRVGARAPTIDLFLPKTPYPESEEEMYDILEDEGVEIDPDHDSDFFQQMQESGWTIRGKPVFDWIAAYQARLEITSP